MTGDFHSRGHPVVTPNTRLGFCIGAQNGQSKVRPDHQAIA